MSSSSGKRDRYGFVIESADEEDEFNRQRVVEVQRHAWKEFLDSRGNKFDETWLWQYWRDESRYKNQLNKRFMSMFSSKLGAQKQMKELIRRGVPDELRPQVWWACSGGQQKMDAAPKELQYGALVQRIHEVQDSIISVDIEKDLHRTFPGSALLSSPAKMTALRKILYAYALRNPDLGYCQSMNFVGAVLLVHLAEEQAFWVLCALIEDIAPPDYYSRSMIGSRIDQMVFESCVAWKLPQLHAHFKDMNMMIEPVTCPWLLCLFATALPMEHVCRVWDCLLWEGNVVLLRVGLSMLKLKQAELLEAGDFVEVYSLLRSSRSTAYDIASVAGMREPAAFTAFSKGRLGGSPSLSAGGKDLASGETPGSVFSVFTRSAPMFSRVDTLLHLAFDKAWIKSLPRESISRLRDKFKRLLEEQTGANRARVSTVCLSKGLACDDGTGLASTGGPRPTIHSLLVNQAMEGMMVEEHVAAGLMISATARMCADVSAGSGMIWEIESSVREVWASESADADGDDCDGDA